MKRLIALFMLLQSTTVLAQTATEPVTTITMGDDGAVQVPLEFDFPLYGRLFNTSWMYDNGIISFLEPGSPGSISPWQWSASSVDQSGASYFIAALWADIAPTSLTSYTTQGNSTYMKYTWSNIAEYYSQGDLFPRYSTFSTTIKPDGTISTNYASVNLQTSNISSGIVGDFLKGEYQSYYYAPYGTVVTSMADWTYLGSYTPPPPEPPVQPYVPPEVVISPDIVSDSANSSITEEPIVVQPTVVVDSVKQPITEPVQTNTTAAVVTSLDLLVSPETALDKKVINIDAQSIARNNQKNLASLTASVVSTSIQGSIDAGALSAESSMSGSSYTSTAGASAISQTSSLLDTSSTMSSQTTTQSTLGAKSTNGDQQIVIIPDQQVDSVLSIFKQMNGVSTATSDTYADTALADDVNSITSLNNSTSISITDEVNPVSVRSLAAITSPGKVSDDEELLNNEKADSNKDPVLTELAESGPKLETLQVLPIGYFNYLNLTYKDVSFYKDRVIYRKQKPVDNLRILRLLNARSDLNYNKMLEAQYNLEDM